MFQNSKHTRVAETLAVISADQEESVSPAPTVTGGGWGWEEMQWQQLLNLQVTHSLLKPTKS